MSEIGLKEINKDAISFKRLSGKAHTQVGFDSTEEGLTSNIQIALTTVFGEQINPLPVTNSGLTSLYSTDGVVERVRFEIDIIASTTVGTNQSQGYQLKLPAGYSGAANFPAGTYLHEALGRLQIVPSLYGTLKPDGSTEYDPTLFDTNLNPIPKFSDINWNLDPYSGILFVQDPPSSFDTSAARPRFLDAYLYVGKYLDNVVTGASASILAAGAGISVPQLDNDDTIAVDLSNYTAPSSVDITITGDTNSFLITDNSTGKTGIRYTANYATSFVNRSLVDKEYVDGIASGLSIRDAVLVASTGDTSLTGIAVIDGVILQAGDRVLLKDQTDATENGIYTFSGNTLTRAEDFDTNQEAVSGAFTSVLSGDTNIATLWAVSTPDPIDIGTTEINWIQLALPLVYIGGIGINVNGNTIDLDGADVAGLGINWNSIENRFDIAFSATNIGQGESVFKDITTVGNDRVINLRSIIGSGDTTVSTSGDTIVIFSSGGTGGGSEFIGVPDDGTYTDGLFSSWTASTKISNAFDDVNEFLLSLAPPFAPNLDSIQTTNNFVVGNLSFGATRNDADFSGQPYSDVGTLISAVDINGLYSTSGNRRGIVNGVVTGDLNNDVLDIDIDGIPFEAGAFRLGNEGSLVLELNGDIVPASVLPLDGTTNATANSNIAVSEIKFSKFSTGADFTAAPYRSGTFAILTSNMRNGWNYARIIHSGTSAPSDIETNYLEWVYDPDNNNISSDPASFDNIILTGTKNISGVEYNTGGSIDYNVTIDNIYRNVYSDSNNAISFPDTDNLSTASGQGFTMTIAGGGIQNSTQFTFGLPQLDAGTLNPEETSIDIDATLPIDVDRVLGSINVLGRLRANVSIDHPFTSKSLNGGSLVTETGFLVYNINDSSTNSFENFTGENFRLQNNIDYPNVSYANINANINVNNYQWSGTQNLITGDANHAGGMLVFDGNLYYPDSTQLTSLYGIANGDFSSLSNAPAGNPDYSTANGIRSYYRKFKATTTTALASITLTIDHDGNAATFLTDPLAQGTPTSNRIKFELVLKRVDGTTIGYFNPFSNDVQAQGGRSNLSISHSGRVTTCTFTLGQGRVDNGDILVARMFTSDDYEQKVSSINLTI